MTEEIEEAVKEMSDWNEAALIDRIVVWDRWINKGIAPYGTKEVRDAATQIIVDRVNRLRAERDRMTEALKEIDAPPPEVFDGEDGWDACAWMSDRAEDALKETGHD
jgi:hypothetical protein